jgi:hypothetical protein
MKINTDFLIANLIIYKKEKKYIPNKIHKSDYNKYQIPKKMKNTIKSKREKLLLDQD